MPDRAPRNDSARRWRDRYGPVALVLGGSQGIGAAFTRALATAELEVVSAALADDALGAFRGELDGGPLGDRVSLAGVDLTAPDAVARVATAVGDREVGLLVYNAGISRIEPFLNVPLAEHERMLDVNARGVLRFVHRFAPEMVARGRGGIVLLSSMAGLQGAPDLATYAATKAFDLVLGESLGAELAPRGVDVLTVVAGATRTPGWEASGASAASSPVMSPEALVDEALRALGRRSVLVPGGRNRLATAMLRLLPRRWATSAIDRATRRMRG